MRKVETCKVASFQEMLDIESVCQFIHVHIGSNRFIRLYINFFIIRFLNFMQETKPYTRTRTIGMTLPTHWVYGADNFQTLPSIEIFFPARQIVYDRNIDRAITSF